MTKESYPLSRVYQLLEPGPVVLVTTAHKGKANIMTMLWLTMMEFEPPAGGLCDQRAQLQFRCTSGNQGMRAQHPVGGTGKANGGSR